MKKIFLTLSIVIFLTTLFSACTSKTQVKQKAQTKYKIDTKKVKDAFNELDKEIEHNK